MGNPEKITFNLDPVLALLRNGVRRADVFMGMGLNASTHEPPISHLLTTGGLHHIRLVKEELSAGEQAHVSEEFGKWIRANGLRDLVETFSIFLDRLYAPTFLLHAGVNLDGGRLPLPARFERMGIADKAEVLRSILPVGASDLRAVSSLNQARNCYAHRRGIVGAPDIDNDRGNATIHWNAFQLEVRESDGTIRVEDEIFGRVYEEGGMVQVRVVERTRTFALGAELVLGAT